MIFILEIALLFKNAGAPDMEKLPEDPAEKGKFAKLFKHLNDHLEAAHVQGFRWDTATYYFEGKEEQPDFSVAMVFNQQDYLILAQRYKEMISAAPGQGDGSVPYDIDGYLTQIDTGMIDTEYMNSRFKKFLMELGQPGAQEALAELHKTFATLTQEEQRFANILIYDIQSGKPSPLSGKMEGVWTKKSKYLFNRKLGKMTLPTPFTADRPCLACEGCRQGCFIHERIICSHSSRQQTISMSCCSHSRVIFSYAMMRVNICEITGPKYQNPLAISSLQR